jgi:hypothetical protein
MGVGIRHEDLIQELHDAIATSKRLVARSQAHNSTLRLLESGTYFFTANRS